MEETWEGTTFATVLGERIRAERKRRGLTQEQLARLADLSAWYIGRIETGNARLSVEVLVDLAFVLGIDTGELAKTLLPRPVVRRRLRLRRPGGR